MWRAPFSLTLIALPFVTLIASCGDSSSTSIGTFSAEPLVTVTSASGNLKVDLRTSPSQPPSRGQQSVQLVITDAATGAPKTGLDLVMTPWMPAMGHGASVTPSVTEKSPGTYVVDDVDLFMPGTWELRTTIAAASQSKGTDTDHVAPSFQIP